MALTVPPGIDVEAIAIEVANEPITSASVRRQLRWVKAFDRSSFLRMLDDLGINVEGRGGNTPDYSRYK